MNAMAAPRTPKSRTIGAPVLFLVLLAASIASLSGDWASLFSLEAASKMLDFAAGFFPPAGGSAFLAKTAYATLETLAMSIIGTVLAMLGGIVLALPAAGRWGGVAHRFTRLLLNILRAIPELVWASMVVVAAGLGPFAGTLALGLHTTGVLGRLFAESLENVAPQPNDALRHNGATALGAFWYSTLPQVLPQLISYSLYRLENNIRAATVLGVVGAGGLGQMLYFHLSLFQTHEASTVLFAMIALVFAVDIASNRLRMRLTT